VGRSNEHRRVIDEARQTVERTSVYTTTRPVHEENRVERWKRLASEREREREQAKADIVAAKHVEVDLARRFLSGARGACLSRWKHLVPRRARAMKILTQISCFAPMAHFAPHRASAIGAT